ncbi:MAG TPA: ATP-binding cassette domain-containing protein, partial [Streptosporangiaceae bacterium]
AGKSTLIKGVAGIYSFDAGEYLFEGTPVSVHDPKAANALGIEVVYQDLALCDNLDIVQNMMLGHEKLRGGILDEISMEKTAKQTLSDLAVTTVRSVRQTVGSLSGGQRQSVAVAKAVMLDAQLVIMDEPTAALGVSQTELVLTLIQRLASRGHAVIVISHNLNDVFRVADRIAVLYLGRLVAQGPASEFDRQSVVDIMTTGTSARRGNGNGESPGSSGGSNGLEG